MFMLSFGPLILAGLSGILPELNDSIDQRRRDWLCQAPVGMHSCVSCLVQSCFFETILGSLVFVLKSIYNYMHVYVYTHIERERERERESQRP